jgi:hypothetical protein
LVRPERHFSCIILFPTETSTFFKAAIEGNFKEGVDQQVKMLEESEETFEHFVHWLYRGGSREEITPLDEVSECAARIKETIDLYVLADKVGCPALERDMVREFYLLLGGLVYTFPMESVEYLYGLPISAAPLRDMTVAYYVWEIETRLYTWSKNLQSLLARFPEFTKAVLIEMSTRYGLLDAHSPFDRSMDIYLSKYLITDGRASGGKWN